MGIGNGDCRIVGAVKGRTRTWGVQSCSAGLLGFGSSRREGSQ